MHVSSVQNQPANGSAALIVLVERSTLYEANLHFIGIARLTSRDVVVVNAEIVLVESRPLIILIAVERVCCRKQSTPSYVVESNRSEQVKQNMSKCVVVSHKLPALWTGVTPTCTAPQVCWETIVMLAATI